ncbi:hypothetical protein GCM10007276_35550 [Agaricicola taiwanensis]|uniref:Uncharacterized protein n=1 Tax=Agaricicola taiwanensis TaxID=591372 RepID=A0A8J2YNB8_9RHOB|nr:hypothetical protein GCM10007276_35550 [Agaricicola taiwanensis]
MFGGGAGLGVRRGRGDAAEAHAKAVHDEGASVQDLDPLDIGKGRRGGKADRAEKKRQS